MTKPLLLVDFDRTLFDTTAFVEALWRHLAQAYGVDQEKEQARAQQFYQYVGEQYDYYFFDHMAAIEGVPPKAELVSELQKAFAEVDFLFDDCAAILPEVDAIVTFGNREYQELKLSLCPELAAVPTHIIQTSKGPYIAQRFGDQPTVLIDDKASQPDLPPSTTFVHLDRSQGEPVRRDGEQVSISSLRYYRQALAQAG